jgi:hypothetical protein
MLRQAAQCRGVRTVHYLRISSGIENGRDAVPTWL